MAKKFEPISLGQLAQWGSGTQGHRDTGVLMSSLTSGAAHKLGLHMAACSCGIGECTTRTSFQGTLV